MTNTKLLQSKMKLSGVTIKTLADSVGISATTLFNKMHGHCEFLASEIDSIAKELSLTSSDRDDIFFAKSVE